MAEEDSHGENGKDFQGGQKAVMLAKGGAEGEHADNPERLIVHPPVSDYEGEWTACRAPPNPFIYVHLCLSSSNWATRCFFASPCILCQ